MTIKRSDAVFISSEAFVQSKPKYCPICEKYNIRHQLNKRVYNDLELIAGMLPSDHDRWLQCFHCGNVFLKDRVAQEGMLKTELEITKPSIHQDEHLPKPKHQRGFNERLQQEPEIKDKEVLKELKKGAKLISYSER